MIGVLFLQSQSALGADTMMHAQLMRYLDRDKFEIHVACSTTSEGDGYGSPSRFIRQIPNTIVRPTYFGPRLENAGRLGAMRLIGEIPHVSISLLSLARYIKQKRIRIIHCAEKARDVLTALTLSRLTGARYVIHLHVKWENWIKPEARWAMRHADAVVGVSRFAAESAIAIGGCRPGQVYHVVNGIEVERWDPTLDGRAVRRELGIPDDVTVLAIVARMFSWKGHIELIRSLALVKEQTAKFHLLVVGEDELRAAPGRPPLSLELKALISQFGLQENVTLTGYRKDVANVMASMDIYTMPSFEEPLGLVYLEAMAMAKPVIALQSGGAPEAIVDGETGYLCTPGDIAGYAEKILYLMRDPCLRRRMGQRGREHVEKHLTARQMAKEMEEVYVRVLASG